MRRALLIALVFLLAAAGEASAHTTIDAAANTPYQRWVDGAKVPTPDLTLAVVPEGCPGREEPACTWEGGPIYLARGWADRGTFLHELGHQFDYVVMSDAARDRFRQIIGDERPWRSSPNSPHEKFAEAFNYCARFGDDVSRKEHRQVVLRLGGGYLYRPYYRVHRQACALIRLASRFPSGAPQLPPPGEAGWEAR